MPSNLICQFFERNLKHSRSASNLLRGSESSNHLVLSQQGSSTKRSPGQLSIMVEYEFDGSAQSSSYPPPIAHANTRPTNSVRTATTPIIRPPDELFLSIIRRRSAGARLEEQRIQGQNRQYHRDDDIPTPVAIAHALPPQYFDLPPEYESPREMKPLPRLPSSTMSVRPRTPELFLEDSLHAQIDQAIADFTDMRLMEATPPVQSVGVDDDALVSPINEVDILYLERRKQRRRRAQQEHSWWITT